jgi:hypothetical protein
LAKNKSGIQTLAASVSVKYLILPAQENMIIIPCLRSGVLTAGITGITVFWGMTLCSFGRQLPVLQSKLLAFVCNLCPEDGKRCWLLTKVHALTALHTVYPSSFPVPDSSLAGARGRVVAEALCYKTEGREFETQ